MPAFRFFEWRAWLGKFGLGRTQSYRWAFLAGVALPGAGMITPAIRFSWLSMGVHGFFVFKWFQGQAALRDLKETPASS